MSLAAALLPECGPCVVLKSSSTTPARQISIDVRSGMKRSIVTLSAHLGMLAVLCTLARLFHTLGDRGWGGEVASMRRWIHGRVVPRHLHGRSIVSAPLLQGGSIVAPGWIYSCSKMDLSPTQKVSVMGSASTSWARDMDGSMLPMCSHVCDAAG